MTKMTKTKTEIKLQNYKHYKLQKNIQILKLEN